MSIPISFITCITTGFSFVEGTVPALITLNLSSKLQLKEIQNFLDEKGETLVNINISENSKTSTFKLKNLRNLDRKTVNILRNKEISVLIH